MPSFVRPAAWLRQLFTQSRTEHSNPSRVSAEVSLIQPYDGSGWGIEDPQQWAYSVNTGVSAGAAGTATLVTVGENEIFRLLSLAGENLAGTDPGGWWNQVINAEQYALTTRIVMNNGNTAYWAGERFPPVLGPGHILQFEWTGGNASTQPRLFIVGIRAPLGTVFYV